VPNKTRNVSVSFRHEGRNAKFYPSMRDADKKCAEL
jgi:hypothetical protein